MRILFLFAIIATACGESPPPTSSAEELVAIRPVEVEVPDMRVEALAEVEEPEPEPEPEPEAIPVSAAVAQAPPPYRNPHYLTRCRRESRREAAVAETIHDRDEARSRALAMARAGELDELLLLNRIAYGETGTPRAGHNDDPSTPLWDEVEAFLAVLDRRRGHMSRIEMFVSYSTRRVFPREGQPRNQWIAELQLDGTRPPSWPRNAREGRGIRIGYPSWRTYGCPRWLATVDAVRRLLQAHPRRIERGPCEEQPDHWGGAPGLDDHALRLGWRLINCGTTRNRFWVVPSEEEAVTDTDA